MEEKIKARVMDTRKIKRTMLRMTTEITERNRNLKNLVIVGTVSNICVLHTAASAGLRYLHIVVPANGISALNDFDQALTLRQISWLYTGTVVRRVEDVLFEDVVTVEVPKRRFEWCRERRVEEEGLAQMGPQERRIAELEAQLCERDAVITELKSRQPKSNGIQTHPVGG